MVARQNDRQTAAEIICQRWRLSNAETDGVVWQLVHEATIRQASTTPWPRLQRILVHERVLALLTLCEAIAAVADDTTREIDFCRDKLRLPPQELNPAPLVDGDDLRRVGIPPGPIYSELLMAIRDRQLMGVLTDKQASLQWALQQWNESKESDD
jgi:hypothetical protein